MSQPVEKEPLFHFFIYLIAGASMGGFLDTVVFDQPTPLYGMIFGAIVAVLYQAVIWLVERRREKW